MEFKDWLNERYQVDAQARDKGLEKRVFNFFSGNEINVVDLGAGTGSNFRYYSERLPAKKQRWLLMDQNQELLDEAFRNISIDHSLGTGNGPAQTLTIKDGDLMEIEVEFRQINLFENEIDWSTYNSDLIVANALFDLASRQQFEAFVENLPLNTSALLLTLNYESTHFHPLNPLDHIWIGHFHEHMRREQAFGRSMGADCVINMAEILEKQPVEFHKADSVWHLNSHHQILQGGIMDFMENAMSDMGLDSDIFRGWLNERRELLNSGKQTMEVLHSDFLCLPRS